METKAFQKDINVLTIQRLILHLGIDPETTALR